MSNSPSKESGMKNPSGAFHPYECDGVLGKCPHCLALKNHDTKHIKKCALCEDGLYWDAPKEQSLYKVKVKKIV